MSLGTLAMKKYWIFRTMKTATHISRTEKMLAMVNENNNSDSCNVDDDDPLILEAMNQEKNLLSLINAKDNKCSTDNTVQENVEIEKNLIPSTRGQEMHNNAIIISYDETMTDIQNPAENNMERDDEDSEDLVEDNNDMTFQKRKRVESIREINKKRKIKGEEYKNYKGETLPKKTLLPNPCQNKKCQNNCQRYSEDEREKIFKNYWSLGSMTSKESFILNCIKVVKIKRKRSNSNKRCRTFEYFLPFVNEDENGVTQNQVCQQFLLNTLDISQRKLGTVRGRINLDEADTQTPVSKKTTYSEAQLRNFDIFVQSLPAVPSHYCRSSTSRKYLPSEIKTFENLYRMYVRKQEGQVHIKRGVFMKLFKKNYNIGIHVPRKDKCKKCESHKNKENKQPADIEIYNNHISEKDYVKKIFLEDQENSKTDQNKIVASFDLQKVLTTPHGDSFLLGFSRKYAVYNFTVYETGTRNGYCYVWEERNAQRGGNEICTCLFMYLQNVDQQKNQVCHLSLYCDNCMGQNKNRQMLAMIQHFLSLSKKIRTVSITYLVPGHTYMPVDSMHAVIEKSIQKCVIQAPSEWPTILRNARLKPSPYVVKVLHYSDFLDWKSFSKKIKIKDGRKDVKITTIKKLFFEKGTDDVRYKINFNEEEYLVANIKPNQTGQIKKAYVEEQKINPKKLENLLDLCRTNVIKPEYHAEYFSLRSNANVPDILDQSDIEDETQD
jgi:hypothetical protein